MQETIQRNDERQLKCLRHRRDMEDCAISVIMPVYQSAPYLETALASVRSQAGVALEIICVDDGSTDGSQALLLGQAEADDRISVYSQPHLGVGEARNAGIAHAVGEYIYLMDSDDLLVDGALQAMLDAARANDLDVLCFDANRFYDESCTDEDRKFMPNYHRHHEYPACAKGSDLFAALCENREFLVTIWAMLCRRALLAEHDIAFYPGIVHNDNIFVYQAMLCAQRAGHLPKRLYLRRIRRDSIMTSGRYLRSAYSYAVIANVLQKHHDRYAPSLSDAARKASLGRVNAAIQNCLNDYRHYADSEGDEPEPDINAKLFQRLIVERVASERRYEARLRQKDEALQTILNSRLYRILERIRRVYRGALGLLGR